MSWWLGRAQTSPMHDAREYDAIVASGEQVTAGLLAIALQAMGIACAFMARLADPDQDRQRPWRGPYPRYRRFVPDRAVRRRARWLSSPAFRALDRTTASRRSDVAARIPVAVAIAAAVKADRCDIYTDVDGVYTTDPRVEPKARRMTQISFEEMLEMASLGAKVLQVRSVELAMVHKVRTFVQVQFRRPRCAGHG